MQELRFMGKVHSVISLDCGDLGSHSAFACSFYNRPPLLDIGFLQRAKRLRRLLVARRNLKALIGEALTNFRIG
jgi:hypothetical protein